MKLCSRGSVAAVAFLSLLASPDARADNISTCFGTTANGRLENARELPSGGPNFSSYSTIGRMIGRTHVHSSVSAAVLAAYAAIEQTLPDRVFVYGETGKEDGGPFGPHKTHQNGLSVDFMVPVVDENGESVKLPTHVLNKWGYDLEFNDKGELDDLRIDFEAIAEHIYQLHRASKTLGGDLRRVILAPELQRFLRSTKRWDYLERNVEFSQSRSWVRHDEHYHIDFDFPCEPLR